MSLRIAIAKPDWGITGGFELLTAELARRLEQAGHDVRWMPVKVFELPPDPYGLDSGLTAAEAPEFLRVVGQIEQFSQLELGRADLVISTQPPSYAVDHPHHLSLFSHHVRCYYDLSDVMIEAGLIKNVEAHRHAERLVRAIDAQYLGRTPRILATSEEVKRRLSEFNGLDDTVGVFHAGLGFSEHFPEPSSDDSFEYALCVSRHEFPKRTELFVNAMAHAGGVAGVSVGMGGRLGHVIAAATGQLPDRDLPTNDRESWCKDVPWLAVPDLPFEVGPVRFDGFVTAEQLDAHYRKALCVVAPAYLEDYGLTAIEAMAYGKPLIVCSDGGNLVNFVTDGVNGLIVEPTAAAIGEAIARLADDREFAAKLGAAARELAHQYTWENGMREFERGMDEVLAS